MSKKLISNLAFKAPKRGISIRIKLTLSVLVPVIFIVILGVSSYQKASTALIKNYEASTESTVKLTADYYDMVLETIASTSFATSADSTLKAFFTGVYESNVIDKMSVQRSLKESLISTVISNKYLDTITLVPDKFGEPIVTGQAVKKDFFDTIKNSTAAQNLNTDNPYVWVGRHTDLDTDLKTSPDHYALSIIRIVNNSYFKQCGYELIDINYKKFKEAISNVSLCEGSVIALITPDGRELSTIISDKKDETLDDKYITGESFMSEVITGVAEEGSKYVTFKGDSYLLVFKKLATSGFTCMALVPESNIVKDANAIYTSTVIMVLISSLVAILIGTLISSGFSKAIKKMMKGLEKASNGDLTVVINIKRRDEFHTLEDSINSMIKNVRNLLIKANGVTEVVDAASEEVNSNADVMLNSTEEIKNSIHEIDAGIVSQAEDAEKCLHQMDALSSKIEEVAKSANNISKISEDTRDVVSTGIKSIEDLNTKANDTKNATENVIACIEELNESSASIEQIIGVINSIASQTSLLSLNASIEAARAGDAGRGFNVVAEEIRKLADQSMDSVKNIQAIVEKIRIQTANTVAEARKSSEIVNSQTESLENTVEVFNKIDGSVASLTNDLDAILAEIHSIEDSKKETLSAIESISAISQETAAVTSTVAESAEAQLEAAKSLAEASKALRTDSEDLSSAINVFTI